MYIAVVYNLYGLLPPNEYSRTNTFTVFFAYLLKMYRQPSTNIVTRTVYFLKVESFTL